MVVGHRLITLGLVCFRAPMLIDPSHRAPRNWLMAYRRHHDSLLVWTCLLGIIHYLPTSPGPAMNAELLLQWLVIAPLMLWSTWRVAKQFAPRSIAAMQNRIAQALVKRGYPKVGSWMQSGSTDAGCGSGCSSCNACGPSTPEIKDTPVQWRDAGPR